MDLDIDNLSYKNLSFQNQLSVRLFVDKVKKMSLEQAKYFLVLLEIQNKAQDETYQKLLAHNWGIMSSTGDTSFEQ